MNFSDSPIRIQGKLTIATPTQNMKKIMRMVMIQEIIVSSNLTPDSFMMTRAPRTPMIKVTITLVVKYMVLRPYLQNVKSNTAAVTAGYCIPEEQ